MTNQAYDISKSHTVNKIETAREMLPALKQQIVDQVGLKEIDDAIAFYQSVFDARQFLFCVELAAGNTKTGSMRVAGYKACSAKWANSLLDAHQSGVNHCFQLMLKRRYMTDVVDKKWITSKLIHIIEEAQDLGHHKVMVAALAECNKMMGNYQPIKIAVQEHISVQYSFLNMASQPILKEVVADIAPTKELIDMTPLSEAAVEFSQIAIPEY